MEKQQQIEEMLLDTCPVCGGDLLIQTSIYETDAPIEGLVDQGVYNVNMSSEWDARLCESCGVAWAVCRWVTTDFNEEE